MQQQTEEDRLETGVPGLDAILKGGLIPGSVYIIQGSPGAGKTILANQICFHRARLGNKALYVTLLAESHDRLLGHLGRLTFFDGSQVPNSIFFISGFDTLSRDGLKGILHLLRSESRTRDASLIVLDGLFALEETAQSAKEFRKFINDLTTLSTLIGCTVLLLTNNARRGVESVEYTMVDGWIELEMEQNSHRSERFVRILKYRGSDFVEGRHAITISGEGMHVFPRLEALAADKASMPPSRRRLRMGVSGLDDMLDGGLPAGTTTLIVGPSGVGKTTIGLHFIAGSSEHEPGLIFNFYETAEDIRDKSEAIGRLLDAGQVEIERHAPTEQRLDVLVHRLLALVRQRCVKRLLVDGIDGFSQSVTDPERLPQVMTALSLALRQEGVTVVYTLEQPALAYVGDAIPLSMSSMAQNILLLRYVELESEMRRGLTVLKMRDSAFDPKTRELEISSQGMRIGSVLPPGVSLRGEPSTHKN